MGPEVIAATAYAAAPLPPASMVIGPAAAAHHRFPEGILQAIPSMVVVVVVKAGVAVERQHLVEQAALHLLQDHNRVEVGAAQAVQALTLEPVVPANASSQRSSELF